MSHKDYLNEKFYLKHYAVNNNDLKNDKPLFNMLLNDYLDAVIKSNIWLKYSEKRQKMYFNWLQNYVCSLQV